MVTVSLFPSQRLWNCVRTFQPCNVARQHSSHWELYPTAGSRNFPRWYKYEESVFNIFESMNAKNNRKVKYRLQRLQKEVVSSVFYTCSVAAVTIWCLKMEQEGLTKNFLSVLPSASSLNPETAKLHWGEGVLGVLFYLVTWIVCTGNL